MASERASDTSAVVIEIDFVTRRVVAVVVVVVVVAIVD